MQLTRVLSGVVGLALVGTLNVGLATSADAVPRPVPIRGTQPKPQVFFIKGFVGLDYAGRKVKVQRKVRPGAKWETVRKAKTSKTGKYKVRIARAKGSSQTCFRIKVPAYGAYEKGVSRSKCIIQVF